MSLFTLPRVIRHIVNHPLTKDEPSSAISRFARWQIGSRLVPGPVIVPFVAGSVLAISRGMTGATQNVYTGMHDFVEMSFLLHVLREQSLFLDVGANVGVYTVLASAAARARSVSFEPLPSAFQGLLRNVRLNGIEDLCELHNVGLAGADGVLKFTRDSDTMNRVVLDGQSQRADIVEVPVTTLDAVVGTRTPSLLKIDVEGFETEVLRGAGAVLSRESLNAIIIELNGAGAKYGFDDREIHRRLLSLDFAPYYYLPFERKLCELAAKDSLQANAIYVRNPSVVRTLVENAARQSVMGCSF